MPASDAPRAGRTSRRPLPRAVLVLLLALVPAACSDGPSGPGSDPDPGGVELAFQAPDGLQGRAGRELVSPVTVVATDGRGNRAPGTPVELRTPDGGRVTPRSGTTDAAGRLDVRWTLAAADTTGVQRLVARASGGAADTLAVTAVPEGQGDVIVVRGARAPLEGALVLRDQSAALVVAEEHARPDTVIPLRLRGERGPDTTLVAVFPGLRRPVLREVGWTDGADSVIVELAPPVGIDLEVTLHVDTTTAAFDREFDGVADHLAAMRRIWAEQGAGLVLDSVAHFDQSGQGRVDVVSDRIEDEVCDQPAGDVVRVEYVHTIDDGGFSGYACSPDDAFMTFTVGNERLLAHELGHVFDLNHVPTGLMNPGGGSGEGLTAGQIFRLHFDEESAVNAVFGAHPEEVRRRCDVAGRCLPPDFTFGS